MFPYFPRIPLDINIQMKILVTDGDYDCDGNDWLGLFLLIQVSSIPILLKVGARTLVQVLQ